MVTKTLLSGWVGRTVAGCFAAAAGLLLQSTASRLALHVHQAFAGLHHHARVSPRSLAASARSSRPGLLSEAAPLSPCRLQ